MTERSGKVIVLTGVTRGLGRAMARGFARAEHRVVGCGRTRSAIEELKREVGLESDFDVVDLADESQIQGWAERVLARFGAPDLLLNNAAMINANAPLWEVPAEEFDRVVDVNVNGVARVLRAFVPAMVERREGVIVNFSSGWGRSTAAEVAPYCATKWAIEGLTRALAQELPEGMAAIPLNPGIIDTEMLRSTFGAGAGQFLDPESWAKEAVPFLLALTSRQNGKPLTVPGQ